MEKEILATHKKVSDISNKVRLLIAEETKDEKEEFKWLIIARIINSLFSSFYLPTILKTEAELDKKESPNENT